MSVSPETTPTNETTAKLDAQSEPAPAPAPAPTSTSNTAADAETPSTATTEIPAAVLETPAAPAESTPAPTTAPRERELVPDARLAVLRGMFPDFDDSLLQSVLNSVGGDTDRAIDALLGMSDPDYHSEPVPQAPRPQTQEELDEQLARTLMLQDQEQESQYAWRMQEQPMQQQQQQQRPQARRQGSSSASERDTMAEFQEQFNKFAESGKKTLGSLFSKVKAKIQEFDQPAGGQSQAASNYNSYNAGVGGDTYPYEPGQNPYPSRQQQQAQAQAQQQQQQAQMPAYYDPNAADRDAGYSPPGSAGAGAAAVGYDVGAGHGAPAPAPAAMGIPGPPSTNSGAPQIDGGKLGMLPKRPVSLLRTTDSNSAPSHPPPSSDDDGELEYAENPFEEGRK